jgi:hypothetical protein
MSIPRKQPLEPHWNFAIAATIGNLETLVWGFESINARIDATGHMFAGVPEPIEIIAIIDRFLAEDDIFYQGDITRLKEMRQYLVQHISPIFESGWTTAQQYWERLPKAQYNELYQWTIEDFRAEAKAQAPENAKPSQLAWFIEGFCKSWRDQEVRFLANSIGKEWPIPPR